MYTWIGLSKYMQKLEMFLKTMIIPFCSMSLCIILLLQTCESLIFFCMCDCFQHTSFDVVIYSGSVLEYFVVIVWILYICTWNIYYPHCATRIAILFVTLYEYNYTYILPMFLRAIKWKCSLLTFDFRHTVKVHEGKFPVRLIKSCPELKFCSSY